MPLIATPTGFVLQLGDRPILRHTSAAPCVFVGVGEARMDMHRGNFDIEDRLTERTPLRHAELRADGDLAFAAGPGQPPRLIARLLEEAGKATLEFTAMDAGLNRFWLRIPAEPDEHVWGGGEQMSYLDMRHRHFPMWTSEPGVGRDKTSPITFQADRDGRAGGDYWTTNYPQPTFLSSRRYAVHVETTAYAALDFRDADWHEVEAWAIPQRVEIWVRPSLVDLVGAMADRFGRQPPLPEWLYRGAIIGLKDGERSFERLERIEATGARVSAIWCEDWSGLRHTSFGARLFWDWRADEQRYPDFVARLAALRARGVRFLGYVNPYLCVDGTLFPEAEAAGLLATDAAGATARVDFGEFDCGVVDFTNPAAVAWFAEHIIGRNMLDAGMSGWMADFGEYLPIDVRLANGVDARLMHNAWPVLWAEVNARAVASRGQTGEALFFMRAGFTGIGRHCPLLWAGDQCVDFSRHDGLVSVIPAALSSGLLGNAFHHSDIGGYTSLFGNLRTPELMMRWAELAAFTPVMRTHEGNRPGENLQIDGDPAVLAHFARMTRLWVHLTPYLRLLVAEAGITGLPVQRPLFLHFETDPASCAIQDAYLYGPDLLVAPVHQAGAVEWETYLPAGPRWVHLWSGIHHAGGQRTRVPAPLGQPPVFFRADTPHRALFEAAGAIR
jgi:alpha-glucosidase